MGFGGSGTIRNDGAAPGLTLGCVWEDLTPVWEDLTLHRLSDLDWNNAVNNLNNEILGGQRQLGAMELLLF